ncbi:hypothetical protein [Candidatus Thiodiazotropha sp. LNASS1]
MTASAQQSERLPVAIAPINRQITHCAPVYLLRHSVVIYWLNR